MVYITSLPEVVKTKNAFQSLIGADAPLWASSHTSSGPDVWGWQISPRLSPLNLFKGAGEGVICPPPTSSAPFAGRVSGQVLPRPFRSLLATARRLFRRRKSQGSSLPIFACLLQRREHSAAPPKQLCQRVLHSSALRSINVSSTAPAKILGSYYLKLYPILCRFSLQVPFQQKTVTQAPLLYYLRFLTF